VTETETKTKEYSMRYQAGAVGGAIVFVLLVTGLVTVATTTGEIAMDIALWCALGYDAALGVERVASPVAALMLLATLIVVSRHCDLRVGRDDDGARPAITPGAEGN